MWPSPNSTVSWRTTTSYFRTRRHAYNGVRAHFCNDNQARGVDEVRARVRQFVEEDVDIIKIMASGGGTKGTRNSKASFTEEEPRARNS